MNKSSQFIFDFRLWLAAFTVGFTFGVVATNLAYQTHPNGYKIKIYKNVAK